MQDPSTFIFKNEEREMVCLHLEVGPAVFLIWDNFLFFIVIFFIGTVDGQMMRLIFF